MNDREAYGEELTAPRLTDSRQTDVGAIGDMRWMGVVGLDGGHGAGGDRREGVGREGVEGGEGMHGDAGRVCCVDRGMGRDVGMGKRVVGSLAGGEKTHGEKIR